MEQAIFYWVFSKRRNRSPICKKTILEALVVNQGDTDENGRDLVLVGSRLAVSGQIETALPAISSNLIGPFNAA
jgi:hypothetical protein